MEDNSGVVGKILCQPQQKIIEAILLDVVFRKKKYCKKH